MHVLSYFLIFTACAQAGQKINFTKSELFVSPNMHLRDVDWLKRIFGVRCVDRPGVYLGANLDFSCRKGSLFSRVSDKIKAKLSNWKIPLLPFAARLVLARHVMLTIPIYLLSVFRAPLYFLNQVKRVVTRFLWHGEKERGIYSLAEMEYLLFA